VTCSWIRRIYGAQDETPVQVCRQVAAEADLYVGVIPFRYVSSTRDYPQLSYADLEFQSANGNGKLRLVFLLGGDAPGPKDSFVNFNHESRQEVFVPWLAGSGLTMTAVSTPEQLSAMLFQALMELSLASSGMVPVEWTLKVPARNIILVDQKQFLANLRSASCTSRLTAIRAVHGIGWDRQDRAGHRARPPPSQ
jgi:hypothetical protein